MRRNIAYCGISQPGVKGPATPESALAKGMRLTNHLLREVWRAAASPC
jgi:hypothetical protein